MTARLRIDTEARRIRLAVRHRLAPSRRTNDVCAIADDLVALHSSDPVTVYLSAAARMRNPSREPVAAALYDDHTLIRHHAMRRTLWVFTPAVARLAHAACTTGLAERERRRLVAQVEASGLAANGAAWLDAARRDVLAALCEGGEATARKLGAAVPSLQAKLRLDVGKQYAADVAAHTRVLLLLGFEGAIVRGRPSGTWINAEYHWAEARVAGGLTGVDPADAMVQLARRWLRSFGPATVADLQWWMGWTMATTRRALAGPDVVDVDLDGDEGVMLADDLADLDADAREPWVALLPALDPSTMGWKRRDWYLPSAHTALLFDRNGNAGPTIWVDGRVVGGWVQRRNGEIALRLLEDVGRDRRSEIDAAAARLAELLGPTRFSVRFPAPIQAELLQRSWAGFV